MRPIDADTALTVQMYYEEYEEWYTKVMTVDELISKFADETPPTIDAVPVIRCRECKYWDGHFCHNKWWGDGYGNYTPPIKREEGFCDWAERKEDVIKRIEKRKTDETD